MKKQDHKIDKAFEIYYQDITMNAKELADSVWLKMTTIINEFWKAWISFGKRHI